jgi:hypothetical protein
MSSGDFSDELFESIASFGDQPLASQALRDAVLSSTTRTIRNRRRIRRAGLAAALMACYLGGVATVSLWPADGSAGGLAKTSQIDAQPNVRRPMRLEDDLIATPPATRLTQYERLCRTGDEQLEKYDDIQAAIRSYKKALQLASADERPIAPDRDTWLMMALKQSIN